MSFKTQTLTWCKSCGAICWVREDFQWTCDKCGAFGGTESQQWDREPVYYVVATDDRYELPLIVADTQAEIARWLGVLDSAVYHALKKSKDGVVHCKKPNRGMKYFRMGAESGSVVRG